MPDTAAPPPDRVLERVSKLLRLAAPDSQASEAERASAALEVVRLIVECDLRLTSPRQSDKSSGKWKPGAAARLDLCSFCRGPIGIGEKVLVKSVLFGSKYAHPDCATET